MAKRLTRKDNKYVIEYNLNVLYNLRQRYVKNIECLFAFTGDNQKSFFRFCREHCLKGNNITFNRMKKDPSAPFEITFLHFVAISKKYKIPFMDTLTINFDEVNYERLFESYGLTENCIAAEKHFEKNGTKKWKKYSNLFNGRTIKHSANFINRNYHKENADTVLFNVANFITDKKNVNRRKGDSEKGYL